MVHVSFLVPSYPIETTEMETEIMDIHGLVAFTGHKISYLRKLCSQRKIPRSTRDGGRKVFFEKSVMLQIFTENKIKTEKEIIDQSLPCKNKKKR